jgi:hypothetical protein
MRPNSATLPGLSRPFASNAHFQALLLVQIDLREHRSRRCWPGVSLMPLTFRSSTPEKCVIIQRGRNGERVCRAQQVDYNPRM